LSRLTDLLAKAKAKDSQLGADLEREFKLLSSRLPFGLNFERHSPEAVELPLRPVRKGDKVRVLPDRGSVKKGDQRLWQVKAVHKATKVAQLELLGTAEPEMQSVPLADLIVVAEFRDTIYPGLVSTGSDRISHTDLVVVENTFNRPRFEAGKIYFLNTQKLGKNSLLVRGHDQDELEAKAGALLPETRPDLRAYTIWDTIQNTIEDPELTLYLVLDEAHRGMGNATVKEKGTIVQRLINGFGSVPGIPVVWGISATVERFNKAIEFAGKHIKLPNVVVDAVKVQESGLIKDTILLDIPDETGDFDTVLVRRATDICQPFVAVRELRKLPLTILDEDEPSQWLFCLAQKDIHLGAAGGWPGGGFDSRFCGHQNAPDSGDLRDLRTRWGNFSSISVRPMVS